MLAMQEKSPYLTPVNTVLVLANVAVYFILEAMGGHHRCAVHVCSRSHVSGGGAGRRSVLPPVYICVCPFRASPSDQ